METRTKASTTLSWDPEARLLNLTFAVGAQLVEEDGAHIVDNLARWIAADDRPFGLLVEAHEVVTTDGAFRARASQFFKQHRDRAFVAVTRARPLIYVVAEMFRIGTGVQLKAFATEDAAREWLRSKGIAA